ncbi:MAG: BON domain-containing protein [Rhodospirillales bacterium]
MIMTVFSGTSGRTAHRAHAAIGGRAGFFALLLCAVLALPGCGVVVGAGAATGITAYQERGVEGAAEDLRIQIRIMDKWLNHDSSMVRKLGIEVYESRVLLTGIADSEKMRADAVRLTWQAAGVKEVLNEIQLPGQTAETSLARDSWITAQLKSKITFDQKIYAVNYFIETVNGTVYLLGVAQNQTELDRVVAHAKRLTYVNKVISHVRLKKQKGA